MSLWDYLKGIMVISWLSTLGTFLHSLCLCGEVDSCLGLALAFFWLTSWSLFLVADAWGPLLLSWDMSGLEEDWCWRCCLHPCILLLPDKAAVTELLWTTTTTTTTTTITTTTATTTTTTTTTTISS